MDAQLEALRSAVATAETHFDQWCSGQHRRLGDMRVKHKDAVLANKENVATLEQDLAAAKLAGEAMQAAVKEEAREEAERARDVEQLRQRQNEMPRVLGERARDVQSAQAMLDEAADELQELEQEKHERAVQLGLALQQFQAALGLRLETIGKANHIRVVFNMLDRRDPGREFSCVMQVDDDGQYSMQACSPMLRGVDKLVDRLNLDQGFAAFVLALRSKFQAHC